MGGDGGASLDDVINAIALAVGQMGRDELGVTVQEAVQCLLCTLYGVSTNVKHEIKPVNGVVNLLRALNDPYVRKGLGLIIELLRSLGHCLEAAERLYQVGDSCSINVPCHALAYGDGSAGSSNGA